ncbi:transcriptional regulator, BolA protein family [Aliiroseovarius halocynthiae]|uniref:BolA family transcriptional regulator n=1 Tax=Aliiroseovarius halocynthiae TaxID=985055 RepID=A0A545SWS7_9RHOB|nr:BolA family protein [Aliiroseovarius halocynthiae]TQV69411.1 BolA family transcriptional regulator [Aliiroseovarius halocynthiae]SMR72804.1 transcriptional regulator, BolA protein family [Aliiroseovarius halocynthiae]
MNRSERIHAALSAAFHPELLEVIDESEQHRGHAGYQDGGESHFRVILRAPEFADMTRINRHRAVHKALGADLVAEIHALALEISG